MLSAATLSAAMLSRAALSPHHAAWSPFPAACRSLLACSLPSPYSGNIGGLDMRLTLTTLAVLAIVLLSAAAIVQIDAHGHPVALQLALN
ncbi:hypothetical protein GCM10007387_15540 [Pseudoduganella albidiflava]|uniref:Uncharacterized protein n=1 Tax=Pseudoduganella albidiflava TaxID=321983 RepID=A0AA88C238_9BURK|nr:hypothetical protein GCM10007387_15540 [Pseudoduganella albidiflava]